MTRTIVCTATVALAIAALAAPTALARPDSAVRTAPAQLTHRAHPVAGNQFATRPILDRNPVQPDQASSSPVTVSVAPADHGIDWATIGIGIAGSLLAVGAIALITTRVRHPRIAA